MIIFGTKTNQFGIISYKKDATSKQSALLFTTNNKKIATKRPNADNTVTQAVAVDYNGDLSIGSGHMRMKSNSKVIIVKETLTKYFEVYEKR